MGRSWTQYILTYIPRSSAQKSKWKVKRHFVSFIHNRVDFYFSIVCFDSSFQPSFFWQCLCTLWPSVPSSNTTHIMVATRMAMVNQLALNRKKWIANGVTIGIRSDIGCAMGIEPFLTSAQPSICTLTIQNVASIGRIGIIWNRTIQLR